MTAYEEKEYILNGVNYLVKVEVYGKEVDASFSHGHGIQTATEIKLTGIHIMTVYNEDGEVVTSRTIIKQLENIVDADDFEDVEFK